MEKDAKVLLLVATEIIKKIINEQAETAAIFSNKDNLMSFHTAFWGLVYSALRKQEFDVKSFFGFDEIEIGKLNQLLEEKFLILKIDPVEVILNESMAKEAKQKLSIF